LFSNFFWVSAVVFTLVILSIVVALILRARKTLSEPITLPSPFGETVRAWIVGGSLIATTAILFFLLISDHVAGRALRNIDTQNAVKIRATGHQWWWEFRYDDPLPSNILTTANEIHIPVGRPVDFELQATDVIHSFWIPNLHGKRDMIPGHTTHSVMQANRAGEYWGQCAEFCGYQHAKMRFKVVAEPEADYQKWLASSRQPAPTPVSESQKKGQAIFLGRSCVMCHTIQGTSAGGMIGPELTHLASRSYLAAGSLPNSRGYLAGWVADAQQIKPGCRMPPNPLAPDELQALLDYLESLQ
jgi:cytochrome c oxidase subunit 2